MTRKHSTKKRQKLLSNTNGRCAYCGKHLETWHVEHMIPRHAGGTNRTENLVASCITCNRKKARRDIDSFRDWITEQVILGLTNSLDQLVWASNMWADEDTARSVYVLVGDALKKAKQLDVTFYVDRVGGQLTDSRHGR